MNIEFKGIKLEDQTILTNKHFVKYDFSATNFNCAIFKNVQFSDCIFNKSVLSGSKIYFDTHFKNCQFLNVDLSKTTIGSNSGIYENCTFSKCNFKRQLFQKTRFVNIDFLNCKFNGANFNNSSFLNCKFTGKLEDVTFNGIYNTNESEFVTLVNVDFSGATFGEFVTFTQCDLSTCIPPRNNTFDELLYNLYRNDKSIKSTGSNDRIVLEKR
jgi:uncharacterized protein YjbI with pentapeptide repeats